MTRSIPDRIDRLDGAAARLMREPKTQLNTALRNLLFEEAGVWERFYDSLPIDQVTAMLDAPSARSLDALADAILWADPA